MTVERFTADLPDTLQLRVGQTARLSLTGALGAGNTWTVEVEEAKAPAADSVTTAVVEVLPPPPAPASGRPTSSFAQEVLAVTARRPGRARLLLRLARSWAPEPALAGHAIEVIVTS